MYENLREELVRYRVLCICNKMVISWLKSATGRLLILTHSIIQGLPFFRKTSIITLFVDDDEKTSEERTNAIGAERRRARTTNSNNIT